MPLAPSRRRARHAELTHAHGSLNLIPLVDILTAIVFFSLLSAVTLRSALASFDLVQPPAATEPSALAPAATTSAPDLVLRVDRDRFVVRHWRGETTITRHRDAEGEALGALHRALAELTRALGRSPHVTVVPSDDVLYDDLVRVLDEVERVVPRAVALGSRARR
jgi:biopolymer transport protein ExbD